MKTKEEGNRGEGDIARDAETIATGESSFESFESALMDLRGECSIYPQHLVDILSSGRREATKFWDPVDGRSDCPISNGLGRLKEVARERRVGGDKADGFASDLVRWSREDDV